MDDSPFDAILGRAPPLAATRLRHLYDRITKAHQRERSVQLTAEEVDWFVVSGAYVRLLEAVAVEAVAAASARLVARGYDAGQLAVITGEAPQAAAPATSIEASEPVASAPVQPAPAVYSVAALAKHWGCSTARVYKLIHAGELPAFRVGTLYRVRRDAAEDFVSKGGETAPETEPATRRVIPRRGRAVAQDVDQAIELAQFVSRPRKPPR